MSKFNTYFNNDFSGCRLLAKAYDHCRDRNVNIYLVPGFDDCVGVSDGTDKWIAPVIADPFSVNVAQIIADIRDGKNPKLPVIGNNAAQVAQEAAHVPRTRRKLIATAEAPQPRVRRKLVL